MSWPGRPPAPDELRAVCWSHDLCEGDSVCACPCHLPPLVDTPTLREPSARRRADGER